MQREHIPYPIQLPTLEDKEKNTSLKVSAHLFPLNVYVSTSGVFKQTLSFLGTKDTGDYVSVYYLEINKSDLPQA